VHHSIHVEQHSPPRIRLRPAERNSAGGESRLLRHARVDGFVSLSVTVGWRVVSTTEPGEIVAPG
jgi:hypothetical protein